MDKNVIHIDHKIVHKTILNVHKINGVFLDAFFGDSKEVNAEKDLYVLDYILYLLIIYYLRKYNFLVILI